MQEGLDRRTFARFQLVLWALLTTTMVLPGFGRPGIAWASVASWVLGWSTTGIGISTFIGLRLSKLPSDSLKGLRAVLVTLPVAFLGAVAWAALGWGLEQTLTADPFLPPHIEPQHHLVMSIVRGSFLMGFWVALFLGVLLSQRVQQERELVARAQAAAHQAQLELLRSQLNPHFLFNALNSVVALVGENPKAAQTMVRDVSTLLRSALDADGTKETTVAKELEFVRLYVKCEQVRFEDKLQVQFEVSPEVEALRVPPMLLHPLVENAVKHGMRGLTGPALSVRVWARRAGERLELGVENSGALQPAAASSGIGLKSVRERLAALFPGQHAFELVERDGHVVATISLPAKVPS